MISSRFPRPQGLAQWAQLLSTLIGPGVLRLFALQAALTFLALIGLPGLSLSGSALQGGQLWTLLSSGLRVPPAPFFSLIFLLVIAYLFILRPLEGRLAIDRRQLLFGVGGLLLAIEIVGLFFPSGMIRGLLLNLIFLACFARPLERRWGAKRFLQFSLLVTCAAHLLFVPWALSHPAKLFPMNTVALDRALIFTWCIAQGPYLYFPQPLKTKVIIWFILLWCGLDFLSDPMPAGLLPLAGVSCAYILVQGLWRPETAWRALRRAYRALRKQILRWSLSRR